MFKENPGLQLPKPETLMELLLSPSGVHSIALASLDHVLPSQDML